MEGSNPVKVLFLYTEIAQYFLACVGELIAKGVEVHIVKWPVNNEAPFQFSYSDRINFYSRDNYDLDQLLELSKKVSPDMICCSGWVDKDYLTIAKHWRKKGIPVILTLDNHWKGSLKQQILRLISPFVFKGRFSHCWVPGKLQYQYAIRLGFTKDKILAGFYSADVHHFSELHNSTNPNKTLSFPKRFIYVGRYYDFKGITDLWQAFIDLQNEKPSEWELWCLGTGDIDPINHEKIKHFGFVQPKNMAPFIESTGVFVLPSRKEPWGVVVHEFAAAGFPLILSGEVGAATEFLEEGKNGFSFKAGNIEDLKEQLNKIISLSNSEILKMGDHSANLAQKITPEKWAKTLISVLEK